MKEAPEPPADYSPLRARSRPRGTSAEAGFGGIDHRLEARVVAEKIEVDVRGEASREPKRTGSLEQGAEHGKSVLDVFKVRVRAQEVRFHHFIVRVEQQAAGNQLRQMLPPAQYGERQDPIADRNAILRFLSDGRLDTL